MMTENAGQDGFAARFAADVASGDPDRVATALRQARGRLPGSRGPLEQIDDSVLAGFPEGAPWEVVQDFVWLVAHYPTFVPALTQRDKLRLWLAAVLRTADRAAALQVAQYLRPTRVPGADIDAALRSIAAAADRDDFGDTQAEGAEHLVRNLLEQQDTYERTAAALGSWVGRPTLEAVLHRLTPFVRPEDLSRLGLTAE